MVMIKTKMQIKHPNHPAGVRRALPFLSKQAPGNQNDRAFQIEREKVPESSHCPKLIKFVSNSVRSMVLDHNPKLKYLGALHNSV